MRNTGNYDPDEVRVGSSPPVRPPVTRHAALPAPRVAWELLSHIQQVVWTRSDVAYAVRHLSLLDQLELTIELLSEWHGAELELPPNVVRSVPP